MPCLPQPATSRIAAVMPFPSALQPVPAYTPRSPCRAPLKRRPIRRGCSQRGVPSRVDGSRTATGTGSACTAQQRLHLEVSGAELVATPVHIPVHRAARRLLARQVDSAADTTPLRPLPLLPTHVAGSGERCLKSRRHRSQWVAAASFASSRAAAPVASPSFVCVALHLAAVRAESNPISGAMDSNRDLRTSE
ncbi:hypothetical protein C8R43DRAFT_1128531 [Mycena crocata]|nr:hypothetical protein C8R43DRAFT_1128531 [Mycena crocata]